MEHNTGLKKSSISDFSIVNPSLIINYKLVINNLASLVTIVSNSSVNVEYNLNWFDSMK